MEFTLALEFTFSSQRQWRYFTYIVDTAGLHQPPYIRGPHSRCFLLISGHSSNKKSEASELMAFFYLHRRHGWLTPASVYSQSALACYLLISGHSSKRKPAVHTSVTTGFFFPHCLRLHHAHSGAGSCWHCWSVLFDCSYC